MQGSSSKCGRPGPGKADCLEGQTQDPGQVESGEYQVIGQPIPGVPVYTVKSLSGGKTKVLHRNLLLPLHGRISRKVGLWKGKAQTLKRKRR